MLTLWVGQGKDKHVGRQFPLIPQMRTVLEAARARVDVIEQRVSRKVPWVFPNDSGRQQLSIRGAWSAACEAAGVTRMVHDFRRTAVRNLEIAGVPRSIAKQMVGHKTDAIYTRYAIMDRKTLQIGGDKLAEFLQSR
jgi:hypothetical protein